MTLGWLNEVFSADPEFTSLQRLYEGPPTSG
jgi:hypothetical protein